MRIKEIIKEKGCTQAQFAEKLGISLSALNQQMTGKPSLSTLEKIAEALGVEIWELFISPKEFPTQGLKCPHCGKPIKINIE